MTTTIVKQAYTLKEGLETLPKGKFGKTKKTDEEINIAIRQLCEAGLRRIGKFNDQVYQDRLDEELKVIIGKNFAVYFIILWDMMNFCRHEGIATGAARGSAGGSLVSYLLEITALDPIEDGLLFWRFLDPSREEAPDIDIDIADKDRARVKLYLEEEYGSEFVASISTFNYYSFKSAFKGAARVLALPYSDANDAVRNVETFEDAKLSPAFIKVIREDPAIYKLTKALEGRISGVGMHAAGVVISNVALSEITSLESRGAAGEEFRQKVVGLDKKMAELIGLVKIDLLGLKALSVIDDAEQLIKKNHGRIVNWKNLERNDKLVFDMLSQGHTLGIFQAEQSASTKLIKDMGIHSFTDLVASNALVRSGAWNAFGPEFVARKKGHKKAKSIHPDCDWFLKDTQQLALYQEQTMLMCTELAGMSMQDANAVRKLTARKEDKSTLAPYKDKFIGGASLKISLKEAEKLWENIEITSEYQFNKCLVGNTKVEVRYRNESEDWTDACMTMEQLYVMWNEGIFQVQVLGPDKVNERGCEDEQWHTITHVTDQGEKPTVRIWVSSGSYIDSTNDHRHRLSHNWKEAYRIHQGDQIWTRDGKQTVAGRRQLGVQQVYDLGIETEHEAFYANNFVTHNSHSVGYSRVSYAMAWLKYHYPAEFMVALLNNEKDQGSVSDYLAECKRLGIKVETPDVNLSDMHYSTKNNKIYIGLSSIKYISDKLAERIIKQRPYSSYADMRERMMAKGSGLSSRVIASLNAIGASRFDDHPIDPEEIRNNMYEYLGIPSFDQGMINADMRMRMIQLPDYDERGTQMVAAIVKDIVSKNGWTRIEIIDGNGSASFFAEADHGLIKGHKYIMLIANNSLIDAVDLANYNSNHPLVRYLRGHNDTDFWLVGAKARVTKNNKHLATMVYSQMGRLRSCMVFSTKLELARTVPRGSKIRIAIGQMKDGTEFLENIKVDERV